MKNLSSPQAFGERVNHTTIAMDVVVCCDGRDNQLLVLVVLVGCWDVGGGMLVGDELEFIHEEDVVLVPLIIDQKR